MKSKNLRDPAWLIAVREMPCTVCDSPPPCDPAHIRLHGDGGTGLKPSDNLVVPLCPAHHMEQHSIGERTFWAKIFLRDPMFMIRCLQAYARRLYETRETP